MGARMIKKATDDDEKKSTIEKREYKDKS